jgi:hypothetical protein
MCDFCVYFEYGGASNFKPHEGLHTFKECFDDDKTITVCQRCHEQLDEGIKRFFGSFHWKDDILEYLQKH